MASLFLLEASDLRKIRALIESPPFSPTPNLSKMLP